MAAASSRLESSPLSSISDASAVSNITCLHNGKVYSHKERFTSTSIGLKPDHANQCVQCACEVSVVFLNPQRCRVIGGKKDGLNSKVQIKFENEMARCFSVDGYWVIRYVSRTGIGTCSFIARYARKRENTKRHQE